MRVRTAIASGAPERRYPALQPVGEALPPDEFHVPQKIPPDGDGSCDVQLPGASAAAAHEVERAGHEYGKVRYLVYNGGTPKYVSAINEVAAKGYEGIVFSSQARISERPTLASNAPA